MKFEFLFHGAEFDQAKKSKPRKGLFVLQIGREASACLGNIDHVTRQAIC
jgi:hypothetical protein